MSGESATPPLVEAAARVADEVLAPRAEEVDRAATIPADHLAALARAGLFGLAGPSEAGGADADPVTARRVVATIGGACGATFFVWVQHHGVVRTLRDADHPELSALLPRLCSGDVVAGTAFAHVRRHGPPAIAATRVEGGWRLDGHAPWATSWGIAEVFSVAAVTDDDRIVWAIVDPDASGLAARPLALPVLGATGTVALHVDGCFVPDDRVASVEPLAAWRRADRRRAALGQPATIGIAERAVRLLSVHDDPSAARAAAGLEEEIASTWARDAELLAALADTSGTPEASGAPDATGTADASGTADAEATITAASRHRAACLDLARRSTTALLAATGGHGMDLDHPAQRLAREADFYVIQAQTADGRRATLESVSAPVVASVVEAGRR